MKGINVRQPWYSLGTEEEIKLGIKASPLLPAHYLTDTFRYVRNIGSKFYEMTDHLGNVLATVLDRKTGYGASAGQYAGFNADVASATDYFPFGMEMPGRTLNSAGARFGFNGQEKDNVIAGDGVTTEFKYRSYDARIARFKSMDPLHGSYPWNSTYAFAENRPIDGIDLEGLEWQPVNGAGQSTQPYSKDIIDYKWVGSNIDGSSPSGTVSEATIKWKDAIWHYASSSEGGDISIRNTSDNSLQSVISIAKDNTVAANGGVVMANVRSANSFETTPLNGLGLTGFEMNSAAKLSGTTQAHTIWTMPKSEAITNIDFEVATLFMPLPKGLILFGRGTSLIGASTKASLGMSKMGGASSRLNFYTRMAYESGMSGITQRAKAGMFVQLNHNIPRLMSGKNWATLYSTSAATIWGRTMQNQAIGLGLFNMTLSGFGGYQLSNTGK